MSRRQSWSKGEEALPERVAVVGFVGAADCSWVVFVVVVCMGEGGERVVVCM